MSSVDEDEDYRRLTDQGFKSALHSKSLGLVLAGQPISGLADLSVELEEVGREVFKRLEPIEDFEDLDAGTVTIPHPK